MRSKQPVKAKKQKKPRLSKKQINFDKQEKTSLDCRSTWKEIQIDWIVLRIRTGSAVKIVYFAFTILDVRLSHKNKLYLHHNVVS